jgi:pimeloyl-ACP methyl ester carboxylesterase
MKVSARGMEFDVRVGGPEDGRPVLLLHGFPQHGGMWDGVAARLNAAGLRTYAPDQRGYSPGARPSDVDTYTMVE